MKKYFKLLFVIITAFVVTLGFSVNAEDTGYIDIYYPIHKTDEAGKGLNGVQFTFSSGNYTLTSEELDDGDYLIDYINNYEPEPQPLEGEEGGDIEERKVEDKNEWDNVIKFLPSKYGDAISNMDSWDEAVEIFNEMISDGYYGEVFTDDGYAYINTIIPGYIDETVAPSGYEKEKIVVFVSLYIEIHDNGDKYVSVYSSSNYNGFEDLVGYFKYDSNVNYEELFKKIDSEIPEGCITGEEDYEVCQKTIAKIYKDNGFLTDVADCSVAKDKYENSLGRREELGFDDKDIEYTCVLQIKDKKTIVNPETYGTLITVLILAVGSIGLFVARKTRTN